jgi:flagellum-specific ATP synthase
MHALALLEQAIAGARDELGLVRASGLITEINPSYARVAGLSRFVTLADYLTLETASGPQLGEVVRIDKTGTTVKFLATRTDARLGDIVHRGGPLRLAPHQSWKGRVINALGVPIDGGGPLRPGDASRAVDATPPPAMRRSRVVNPIRTGVRVIDLFTPICAGQRIGIFAGSGVGKSTLLAMLASATGFDSVVIALVGERGREVREFIEDTLAEKSANAITIAATADESAAMRRLAPRTAMTIAEFLRDQGEAVLLLVDSVTRFAHAAREVALAAAEPAVARGYPPSVFADLSRLLERSGPGEGDQGSITGIFSVLVDADDHNEPIADTIRGTLDGHIVLDRAIADQGRFPAVNLSRSISRLAHAAWTNEQASLVLRIRALVARYEDTRDLRLMGGYRPGQDAELDQAVATVPKIYDAMLQSPKSPASNDAFRELAEALQASPKD